MQDIPLLVEGGMAARFALVVVVHADAAVRVRRLVEQRGMPEADARARIAAQADDAARRAVADVWLDNSGPPQTLGAAVDALWDRRLVPFAAAPRRRVGRRPAPPRSSTPTRSGPRRPPGSSPASRPRRGSEAVASRTSAPRPCPACPPWTCSTCSSGCASPDDADAMRDQLGDVGFVPADPRPGYASADPGRPARLHVRVVGSPGWRSALLPARLAARRCPARAEYAATERQASSIDPQTDPQASVAARFAAAAERVGRIVGVGAVVERDESGRLDHRRAVTQRCGPAMVKQVRSATG